MNACYLKYTLKVSLRHQISIRAGSVDMKTLYNLLLKACPILASVSDPLLLADFCFEFSRST